MQPPGLTTLFASIVAAVAASAQSVQDVPAPPPALPETIPIPRAAPMAFWIGASPSMHQAGLDASAAALEAWLARDGHREAVRAQPIKLHLFNYTPQEVGGGDQSPFHWHPHRIAADGAHWAPTFGHDQRGRADVNSVLPPGLPLYTRDEYAAAPASPMAFLVEALPMLRNPAQLGHDDLNSLWLERSQGRIAMRWQPDPAFKKRLVALLQHRLLYVCEGEALALPPRFTNVRDDVVPDGVENVSVLLESEQQRWHRQLAARVPGMHSAVAQDHKRHPVLDALRKVATGPERAIVCLGELGTHPDLLVRRAAADELARHFGTADEWFPGFARAFDRERDPQVLARMLTTLMESGPRRVQIIEQVRTLSTHADLGLSRAAKAALAELAK